MTIFHDLSTAREVRFFGGKAANLARLSAMGELTPAGLVIPTSSFEAHLAYLGLPHSNDAFARLCALDTVEASAQAEAWKTKVQNGEVAGELKAELEQCWGRLGQGQLLAVRSSATGEDAVRSSFAGMFDTCLNIRTSDEMIQAVLDVWASLFSARVLAYARHRQASPGAMAVILQAQVDAVFSGVMFTADPRPGHSQKGLLIEYCEGLGDQLVSGDIHPAAISVDIPSGQVTLLEPGAQARDLPHSIISDLMSVAKRLESEFACPQDVEWSVGPNSRLILLQSRPITHASQDANPPAGQTAHEEAPSGLHIWTNANIAENYPGPVAPLLRSFVAKGFGAYFKSLGHAFGISPRRISAMGPQLDALIGVHAGRLYYNLSHIHAAIRLAPGGEKLANYFNQFVGATERTAGPSLNRNKWGQGAEIAKVLFSVTASYAGMYWRLRAFEGRVNGYARSTTLSALVHADNAQLATHLKGFLDIRLNRWTGGALADTAAMVCYGLLSHMLKSWLPKQDQQALQNDLLKGLPGLASAIPVERLWDLSRAVRQDPDLLKLFQERSPDEWVQDMRAGRHPDFWNRFRDYVERWGFRYSGELMLTQPTPHEDPRPVLRILQTYSARDGRGPQAISQTQANDRVLATKAVSARLRNSGGPASVLKDLAFRMALGGTQAAVRWRERARMKQALLYTRLRHVALALGQRLRQAGVLSEVDDVFYLEMDELIGLAEKGSGFLSCEASLLVSRRKAQEAEWQDCLPPDQFALPPNQSWLAGAQAMPGHPLPAGAWHEALQGSAACGGIAEGVALVALDVADAEHIQAGQILVTRQTDPGWAGVFFLIKGLVIERGGMLSHGAIIAREYGIPAVVGIAHATSIISSGQSVRVDGNMGKVSLNAS